jgi:hypothetical protein
LLTAIDAVWSVSVLICTNITPPLTQIHFPVLKNKEKEREREKAASPTLPPSLLQQLWVKDQMT